MSVLAPAARAWRKWGRGVGRRFAKLDRYEWQARGLGLLEAAGMIGSPLVAVVLLREFGSGVLAVVAAVVIALVCSGIAHECWPELKSERRERLDRAYVKGYRKGVRDQRAEEKRAAR